VAYRLREAIASAVASGVEVWVELGQFIQAHYTIHVRPDRVAVLWKGVKVYRSEAKLQDRERTDPAVVTLAGLTQSIAELPVWVEEISYPSYNPGEEELVTLHAWLTERGYFLIHHYGMGISVTTTNADGLAWEPSGGGGVDNPTHT